MVWTLLCWNHSDKKRTHTPTSLSFHSTPFFVISPLQSYKSGSLHCCNIICFCLVWERNPGFPGLWEKAGASQLPNSRRDEMFIWTSCWCCRYLDELKHTVSVPSRRTQQRLGATHKTCPDKAASGAMQGGRAARGPQRRRGWAHTLPTHRKPPPLQKLTEIRNTPT